LQTLSHSLLAFSHSLAQYLHSHTFSLATSILTLSRSILQFSHFLTLYVHSHTLAFSWFLSQIFSTSLSDSFYNILVLYLHSHTLTFSYLLLSLSLSLSLSLFTNTYFRSILNSLSSITFFSYSTLQHFSFSLLSPLSPSFQQFLHEPSVFNQCFFVDIVIDFTKKTSATNLFFA